MAQVTRGLDGASAAALIRFGISAILVAYLYVLLRDRIPGLGVASLALCACIGPLLIAIMRREKCASGPLTRWDEGAAWLAIAAAARVFGV